MIANVCCFVFFKVTNPYSCIYVISTSLQYLLQKTGGSFLRYLPPISVIPLG